MKRKFVPVMLLILIFVSALISACAGRDVDKSQYEKATVVGTLSPDNSRQALHIKTSKGINATVTIASRAYVLIKFEDEKIKRTVCNSNWIFSAEIKESREKDVLFVKIVASRLTSLNEWENEVKIFEYDLSTRKLVGWVKV